MNNFPLFDQSLILQQQLLLQQMLIYNQMLAQKAKMLSKPAAQPLVTKSVDDNELSSPSFSKQDDTHPIQPIPQISRKKIDKKPQQKKPKQANDKQGEGQDPLKKKKIFLSMLDIKEAQYKKFKNLESEQEIKPMAAQPESQ